MSPSCPTASQALRETMSASAPVVTASQTMAPVAAASLRVRQRATLPASMVCPLKTGLPSGPTTTSQAMSSAPAAPPRISIQSMVPLPPSSFIASICTPWPATETRPAIYTSPAASPATASAASSSPAEPW
jgi:hypothetical protein